MKVFTREEWIKLLKRDLSPLPSNDSPVHQYAVPENLIVTVTTKNKVRRNYTFGGPIWCGILDFSNESVLKLTYLSPLKKPHNIKWNKIKEITLHYIST
jgi:hypothetical protein